MVDMGGANNSTNDIARQIVEGISADDMTAIGKPLTFENGSFTLNGDTGISAGVKDELASIVGQTRIIPIFSEVNGPGNNAQFTIVRFCGVRILACKLTGPRSQKHVTCQPAPVFSKGIVPGTAITGQSDFVYSRAFLVH